MYSEPHITYDVLDVRELLQIISIDHKLSEDEVKRLDAEMRRAGMIQSRSGMAMEDDVTNIRGSVPVVAMSDTLTQRFFSEEPAFRDMRFATGRVAFYHTCALVNKWLKFTVRPADVDGSVEFSMRQLLRYQYDEICAKESNESNESNKTSENPTPPSFDEFCDSFWEPKNEKECKDYTGATKRDLDGSRAVVQAMDMLVAENNSGEYARLYTNLQAALIAYNDSTSEDALENLRLMLEPVRDEWTLKCTDMGPGFSQLRPRTTTYAGAPIPVARPVRMARHDHASMFGNITAERVRRGVAHVRVPADLLDGKVAQSEPPKQKKKDKKAKAVSAGPSNAELLGKTSDASGSAQSAQEGAQTGPESGLDAAPGASGHAGDHVSDHVSDHASENAPIEVYEIQDDSCFAPGRKKRSGNGVEALCGMDWSEGSPDAEGVAVEAAVLLPENHLCAHWLKRNLTHYDARIVPRCTAAELARDRDMFLKSRGANVAKFTPDDRKARHESRSHYMLVRESLFERMVSDIVERHGRSIPWSDPGDLKFGVELLQDSDSASAGGSGQANPQTAPSAPMPTADSAAGTITVIMRVWYTLAPRDAYIDDVGARKVIWSVPDSKGLKA